MPDFFFFLIGRLPLPVRPLAPLRRAVFLASFLTSCCLTEAYFSARPPLNSVRVTVSLLDSLKFSSTTRTPE